MRTRHRVIRAYLRARSHRASLVTSSLQELRSAKLALSAASAAIEAGLHAHMLGIDEVSELLNSVIDRVERAVSQVDLAITGEASHSY